MLHYADAAEVYYIFISRRVERLEYAKNEVKFIKHLANSIATSALNIKLVCKKKNFVCSSIFGPTVREIKLEPKKKFL